MLKSPIYTYYFHFHFTKRKKILNFEHCRLSQIRFCEREIQRITKPQRWWKRSLCLSGMVWSPTLLVPWSLWVPRTDLKIWTEPFYEECPRLSISGFPLVFVTFTIHFNLNFDILQPQLLYIYIYISILVDFRVKNSDSKSCSWYLRTSQLIKTSTWRNCQRWLKDFRVLICTSSVETLRFIESEITYAVTQSKQRKSWFQSDPRKNRIE